MIEPKGNKKFKDIESGKIKIIHDNEPDSTDRDPSYLCDNEGGDDINASTEQMIPEEKVKQDTGPFLARVPPNWDDAAKHGQCNRIYRGLKADLSNPDTYCPCCMMPVPNGKDCLYPLSTKIEDLGGIGPGYPLFLELVKQCGYMMLQVTVMYFIPAIVMIKASSNEIDSPLKVEISSLSIAALFQTHIDIADASQALSKIKITYQKQYQKEQLKNISALMALAIIVQFVWLICLRKRVLKKAADLDACNETPSDYCILIENLKVPLYDPESILEEIQHELLNKFEIQAEDIVYINPVYQVPGGYGEFMKENASLQKWKKLCQNHLVDYMKRQSCSEEEYHAKMANPITRPIDCPVDLSWMAKKWNWWMYLEYLGLPTSKVMKLSEVEEQIKELQPKVAQFKKMQRGDMTFDEFKEAFTGSVYMVLNKSSDVAKLDGWQKSHRCHSFFAHWYTWFMFIPKRISWTYERAKEPSDINWELQGVGRWSRVFRMCISATVSWWIIGFATGVIVSCKFILKVFPSDIQILNTNLQNWLLVNIILWTTGKMDWAMGKLTDFEQYPNKTEHSVSRAYKDLIIKWILVVYTLIYLNGFPQTWFDENGLIGMVEASIITFIYTQPLTTYVDIKTRIIRMIKVKIIRFRGDNQVKMTQGEANKMFEGSSKDPVDLITDYFTFFLLCSFYCSVVPAAIPLCALGSFTFYWTLKYQLLRRNKKPDMLGEQLGLFFANIMPWFIYSQAFGFIVLMISLAYMNETNFNEGWNKGVISHNKYVGPGGYQRTDLKVTSQATLRRDKLITEFIQNSANQTPQFDSPIVLAWLTIGFGICWMYLPIGLVLNLCRKKHSGEETDPLFEELYESFPESYDKSNPLTKGNSTLHAVDFGIKVATKNGDQDKLAKLQAKRDEMILGDDLESYLRYQKNRTENRPEASYATGFEKPKIPGQAELDKLKAMKSNGLMAKLPQMPKGAGGKIGSISMPKMKVPAIPSSQFYSTDTTAK